jgi:hypothetical protein
MTGLTDTAYYTRKGIKYTALGLVLFMVLKFAWGVGLAWWKQRNPPPPPAPEVKFGKLPKTEFPISQTNLGALSYRLETIEGTPPNLPTLGRAYFMPGINPGLLALDRAKEKAKKMGFAGEPQPIDQTTYRFQTAADPPTTLEIETISGNFRLSYPYATDPELLANKILPSSPQAITETKGFLAKAGVLGDDLKEGRAEVSYWRLEGGNPVSAISFSEADFVRVDLFRSNLNDLPILATNPRQSNIYLLFSGSKQTEKRIVEAGFSYTPIDRENFSTYPLKTASQGWQELQAGQGYLANLGQNEDGKITIRRIYLAYFEQKGTIQKFLQPIFVFEGDKNFFAYVSAVDSNYTE